jgi:hypothetical protein
LFLIQFAGPLYKPVTAGFARQKLRIVLVSPPMNEKVRIDADEQTADDVAELDRRWAAVQAGQPTVPHDKVVRWLRTWGSPAYKPWREFK